MLSFKFTALTTLFLAFWSVAAAPAVHDYDPFNTTSVSLDKRARAAVYTKCTVPNTVALTFDDGPYWYLYDIVKALEAAGAKGTFFVNGNNYGCIYDADNVKRLKYATDRGHQLASHTWAHKNLATLTWDQIHDEMWRVELALLKTVGVYPAFMRPHMTMSGYEVSWEKSATSVGTALLVDFVPPYHIHYPSSLSFSSSQTSFTVAFLLKNSSLSCRTRTMPPLLPPYDKTVSAMNKRELIEVCDRFDIPNHGLVVTLRERINRHLRDHREELQDNPQFARLYPNQRGRRARNRRDESPPAHAEEQPESDSEDDENEPQDVPNDERPELSRQNSPLAAPPSTPQLRLDTSLLTGFPRVLMIRL